MLNSTIGSLLGTLLTPILLYIMVRYYEDPFHIFDLIEFAFFFSSIAWWAVDKSFTIIYSCVSVTFNDYFSTDRDWAILTYLFPTGCQPNDTVLQYNQ